MQGAYRGNNGRSASSDSPTPNGLAHRATPVDADVSPRRMASWSGSSRKLVGDFSSQMKRGGLALRFCCCDEPHRHDIGLAAFPYEESAVGPVIWPVCRRESGDPAFAVRGLHHRGPPGAKDWSRHRRRFVPAGSRKLPADLVKAEGREVSSNSGRRWRCCGAAPHKKVRRAMMVVTADRFPTRREGAAPKPSENSQRV